MHEHLPWTGMVTVRSLDPETGEERSRETFQNLITTAGRNLLRDSLLTGKSANIAYMALGAGATAPAAGDVALEDERWRQAVTDANPLGTGEAETIVYVGAGEANGFTIEEIGWFAGSDAGSSAGTGILLARVAYTRAKTDLESLQIDRTDTLGVSA